MVLSCFEIILLTQKDIRLHFFMNSTDLLELPSAPVERQSIDVLRVYPCDMRWLFLQDIAPWIVASTVCRCLYSFGVRKWCGRRVLPCEVWFAEQSLPLLGLRLLYGVIKSICRRIRSILNLWTVIIQQSAERTHFPPAPSGPGEEVY